MAANEMSNEASAAENYAGVFDGRVGFGTRPALLMIDFMAAYTTPGADFYAEGVVDAVAQSVALLAVARKVGIPVIHTRVSFHPSGKDGGLFVKKVPALRKLVPGAALGEFDQHVRPNADELVLIKNYASAFFGTSLQATLSADGVDTIILAGCSTSGCIRATAIDGMQHSFHVIVARECVGDRHQGPHEANLFDINAKYGDVVARDEVIPYLEAKSARQVEA